MPSAALCRRTALNVTSSPGLYTPRSLKTVPRRSGDASFRLNGTLKSQGCRPSFQSLPTYATSPSFSAVTMKANFHQLSAFRRGVSGAVARPSDPVVPVQATWLSRRTIETFAPVTGSPVSSRVTKTSVLRGLSLTVIPRFVTWITDARTRLSPNGFELAIGAPSSTAVQTSPLPCGSACAMSRPWDTMRSAAPPSRRSVPGPAGFRANPGCRSSSVGIRARGARGTAHWVTFRKFRA